MCKERVVTTFALDGLSISNGPLHFSNIVEGPLSNPRSVRWSLHLDWGIPKNLAVRVGYLNRTTTNDLIINPYIERPDAGSLVVSSQGQSRYRELQFVASYESAQAGDWTCSYVWSRAAF